MNDDNELKQLEERLTQLTWWTEPSPQLWKNAIQQADSAENPSRERKRAVTRKRWLHAILKSRWPWVGTPIAAVIVAAVVLHHRTSEVSPGHPIELAGHHQAVWSPKSSYDLGVDYDGDAKGKGQTLGEGRAGWKFSTLADGKPIGMGAGYEAWGDTSYGYIGAAIVSKDAASFGQLGKANFGRGEGEGQNLGGVSAPTQVLTRQVVRKAGIDLKTDDVRGLYFKVQTLVPSEAQGEYVEQSQIQGSDKQLEGYITIRVQSDRLGQVLNMLRGLAEVAREQTEAADVTAQVVDVEARLRNERRIEKELLELLDKRTDAPLQDVLKVRESLASVRERIEQLTGQQQTLAKQVALATVLITIRQKDAPPPPAPAVESFGQRLGKKLGTAWSAGLDFLGTSVAAIMQTIVGGLVFWIGLVAVIWSLRRWYLHRSA